MRVLFTDNEENCSQDKVLMEDREFEAGNILMAVPLDFQEMEEWRKAALYPWEKRPELILQNKEGTVHMTLQLLKREWPETETFQAVLEMGGLLEGTFPVYEQSEVYLMETEKSVIGWLILKMKEREEEHVKAIWPLDEGMALYTLTYREKEREKWHVLNRRMLASVRPGKGSEW